MRWSGGGSSTTDFKYKAFISYSWSDKQHGQWLHRALETYRAPKGSGGEGRSLHPIFKDREEEAAGASIGAAIEAALGASEYLIVLCSPRAAASPWVNREVAWFKAHREPRKILALIVEGEPGASAIAGREAEECFPKALLHKVGSDLLPTEDKEDAPLAADARETGDGRRGAKLKLAAALLGVGLDALVKRDDRRRQQRRRMVMSGMAASIAVLASITIYAVLQRNAAVAAQTKAEAAEQEAELQRDEAQSLVEFMLTDLKKQLEGVGRLDVLQSVADRLLQSYAKQDLGKLDANALGRRARVLLLLGEVDNTRGKLDAALARYKEASATTAELLRRNPKSAQQIFDHAQSVFWVGYIAWQRGDAALAKKQFTEYYDLAQQLVAIDPDKDEWRMEVKYALSNLGTLAMDEGEIEEAGRYFELALDVAAALARAAPMDFQRQSELAECHSWLASARELLGDFAGSESALVAERLVLNQLAAADALNAEVRESLAVNSRVGARISLARGDGDKAVSQLSALVKDQRALLQIDPTNSMRRQFYGWALIDLGEALLATGKIEQALATAREASLTAAQLALIDQSVQHWRVTVGGFADRLSASAAYARGDYDAALAEVEKIELAFRDGDALNEADMDERGLVGSIAALKAATLHHLGARSEAQDAAARAIRVLEPITGALGANLKRRLAESYYLAGQIDKSKSLITELHEAGFRHPEFLALLAMYPDLRPAPGAADASGDQPI